MNTLEMRPIALGVRHTSDQFTECFDQSISTWHQEHPANVNQHSAHLTSLAAQAPAKRNLSVHLPAFRGIVDGSRLIRTLPRTPAYHSLSPQRFTGFSKFPC